MGYLFETIVSAIYRQTRAGQSPPVRLVLNPVQMRQLLAEHAAGCRELGISVRPVDGILGVAIDVDATATGFLVTASGIDVPLIAH
ncbi:hypothetical protein AVMA1855_22695 [Acidovorax sp. SUPP1855]|uniref:hypothetical protein n=1 Tax=Acidovorax sp. SUPP1855 TaxID=431774 RepID=UPI0023DE4622|nr:hypothetical protein [Acidovorax sp. SUPP1855]GKS87013.1 hypothetical protein AVMA1855_22695 [Acidovorax sp. SUPP1855]